MHLILKIGISRNTECVNTVGFPKLGHICQDIPHHMSGTFNKHSSLAIFDKHLVRQTNQGWPKILPQ